MANKKIILVALATILSLTALPALASAPTVSSVTVTTKSIRVVFDQDVVHSSSSGANYSASALKLANYSFQSPTATVVPLDSGLDHYTDYFVSGSSEGVATIFGLNLTQTASWTLGIQNIASAASVTEVMDAATVNSGTYGTVGASTNPVINYIENISGTAGTNSCYGYPCGKPGEQIRVKGSLFSTASEDIGIRGFPSDLTASASDAETIVINIPNNATSSNIQFKVENSGAKNLSNIRYFAVYGHVTGSNGGLKGIFTLADTTTAVDNVPVRADSWNVVSGETKSHSNGKWASSVAANAYDVFFTTPAGSAEAAPTEAGSQTVTADTITNVGTKAFRTANISGTLKDPNGTTAIVGATVTVRNDSGSTQQKAITGTDGTFNAYVPVSNASNYYTIEVDPLNFYKSSTYNYQRSQSSVMISQGSSYTGFTINLTSKNVIGLVKTPTGTTSTANPNPDTAVPNANIGLHTPSWSWSAWTSTDSSGVFEFGGVPAGTNYILEIEAPWGDANFGGYSRTQFSDLTVNASGITDLGTKRFALPNIYGTVLAGGSGVNGAYVSLSKEGFWASTNTDSNGKFRFAVNTSGTYNLRVDAPSGYADYETTITISSSEVSSGKNLGNITLAEPNVTGYVYNSTGTTAVQYVGIDICPYMNPGRCYWAETASDGSFGIGTVPDGTWSLALRTRPDQHTEVAPASTTITVSGGIVTAVGSDATADTTAPLLTGPSIKLTLSDPAVGGLKGVVYGPTGTTGQRANLGLRAQGSYGSSQWSESNSQGQFAFGNVSVGTYELEVMPMWGSSYSRKTYIVVVNADDSVTVDGTSYSGRNIIVRLTQPNITGTLYTPVYSSGYANLEISQALYDQPVQWGWINIHQAGPMMGPGAWYGTNTDENGDFRFGGVAAGTYIIEYSAGWESSFTMVQEQITISEAVAAGASLNLNTASTKAATSTNAPSGAVRLSLPQLKGTVVQPDGNTAVSGCWITIFDSSHTIHQGSNTNSSGQFIIGGLSDGTYNIEVNMPWGQGLVAPSGLSVVVSNDVGVVKQNGVTLANNKITLAYPTKTISGWVKKSGTTAVTNARVEAHKDMGGGFVETRTDSNGSYSLKVSSGSWWVETRPDWGSDIDWVYTESPTRITFSGAETTPESQAVNFSVSATDATITGYVKYPNATAVNNCWVNACQGKGICNGKNTDNNGRFSIKVTSGTYRVMAFPPTGGMTMGETQYGSPDPKTVSVGTNQTADAGTMTVKEKNSSIKGKVQDTAGNARSNVMVNAWEMDGPGWAMSSTNATGDYTLTVFGGTSTAKKWGVMIMPMSTQYVYQGAPLTVEVLEREIKTGNDFTLKIADATISGKVRLGSATGDVVTNIFGGVWVRDPDLGMLDFGGPMTDMMEKGGMMAEGGATMNTSTGGGMPMGSGMEQGGMGTGLFNGGFQVKVPAGTYEVGMFTPPGSNYTLDSVQTVTLAANETQTVNLIVKQNDATISGTFYLDANNNDTYDSEEEVSGIRAMVHAERAAGGWQMTESNTDGTYSLSICAGTWYVDAFIDPFMTMGWAGTAYGNKYMIIAPDQDVVVISGSTNTINFEVKELNATITGSILNPDETAMTEGAVWVFVDYGSADMVNEFKGFGGPGLGNFSNPVDGTYSLNVAAGTYKIGAGIPPWDTRDLINPETISVTVAANGTSTGNDLQFKESDATISGNVSLAGSNQSCYVRAWSNGGGGTGTKASSGSYSLNITQADVWHLVAATEISNILYQSVETLVTTVTGTSSYVQDLSLISTGLDIPDPKTASFDASSTKSIRLDDGLTVDIPAGAIDTSGTITVTVTPTVEVRADSKEKLIGYAYDFEAKDSDGKEISDFVQNVTITMPYNEDTITSLGTAESSLTPKYLNETTNTWETYDTVMRDTVNDRLIIMTDHFSPGGPVGGEVPTAPSNLTAAAQSVSTISLSWTDNSTNETGFKVYRNSADSSWESATLLTTTSANTTSYTSSGLTTGTTYYFRVKATNASGDSAWSSTASATTDSGGGVVPVGLGGPAPAAPEVPEVPAQELPIVTVEKPISQMTISELKAKILEIQQAIIKIQALLAQITGPKVYQGIPAVFTFSKTLKFGQTSDEVKYLQIILKSEIGAPTYPADVPATGYFGPITEAALIAFQEKYAQDILAPWELTQGTGIVGKTTREKLNGLLAR